jgi:ribosomal protein S18 acetylase RimI-like enzyme
LVSVPWTADEKTRFLRHQFCAQGSHYRSVYPGGNFDVIELDGVSIGRLYVNRGSTEIRIVDITLAPDARNRGLGSAILSDLMGEARRSGRPLRIHVERHNPALSLYARLGFRPVADTGVYYLMEAAEPAPHTAERGVTRPGG